MGEQFPEPPKGLTDKEEEVWESLKKVVDPEFGFSIIARGLVDEIKVKGEKAVIKYHLTVPFCPPVFALHIGRQIRERAKEVQGIRDVEVMVQQHMQSDMINETLREEE
ncbi:MAG: metal-sulfur cluster assembly factor [Candidatus Bathyarchaeia archaeon]